MITVDVRGYCYDCLDFDPDVQRPSKAISLDDSEIIYGDTVIRCTHRKRCEAIKRYLERQEKKNEASHIVSNP